MVNGKDKEQAVHNAVAPSAPLAAGPDLAETFRRYSPQVLAAAHRVTGNRQDAEDVLQTVFLRLARREATASPLEQQLGPYLHRAAVNAGLDLLRSRRARRAAPIDEIEQRLAEAPERGPAEIHGSREIRERVRRALAAQSPRAAEIFVLRYFEGYDNKEIARLVGSSASTVGVILHRTRHRLRDEIRSYLETPHETP